MKKIFFLTLFFLQILRGVTTAQNPYESIGKTTEVLTLSNGKYQEFFPNDTIVRIGSVLFNRVTNEVVEFLTEKDSISLVQADVASRFLSVDPIGREYPELTPYQFGSNRPIDGVDLDGLEWIASRYIVSATPVCTNQGEVYAIHLGMSNQVHYGTAQTSINGETYYNMGKHFYNQGLLVTENGSREHQITVGSIIGKQLTSNIESSPVLPEGVEHLPYYTQEKETVETANTYQNPGGTCYLNCLVRYFKAAGIEVKPFSEMKRGDINIAQSSNKNDKYLGYGSGSLLIHRGTGTPVTDEEVWQGKLQEGALLQWWKNPNGGGAGKPSNELILNGLRKGLLIDGHSVIFKEYLYLNGKIDGFIFYDAKSIEHTLRDSHGEKDNKRIYGTNINH